MNVVPDKCHLGDNSRSAQQQDMLRELAIDCTSTGEQSLLHTIN